MKLYSDKALAKILDKEIFHLIGDIADAKGVECYVVGGYVRDIFLERPSADIDVVVVGSGIELASALKKKLGRRAHLSVFKNFGTAQVKVQMGNGHSHSSFIELEFVGARKESYSHDSRKPVVEDGTLEDDQNRRDFTINAMAICLNKGRFGELVDPFNGIADLEDGIIATPLDPEVTFSDDPLRMMRCIRFATQLNFQIEEDTFEALSRMADRIKIVSGERIEVELNKIMMAPHPSIGLELLQRSGLLQLILPEVSALDIVEKREGRAHKNNFYHSLEVVENVVSRMENPLIENSELGMENYDYSKRSHLGVQGNHNSPSPILNSQLRYTFLSNHRDIVLDSAFLDVMLVDHGYPTTVEIGIGDNLLIYPWIKRLVRMNKAFVVRRGLTAHEMMRSSQLMSRYIHYAVTQKHENIWIAQREGRAKDSSDQTQDAVLKMLAMGCDGSPVDSLLELNIVPLTISYEYDPCDYLKAQEMQLKRDNPGFKKSKQDDLDNMKTGIFGYKGRVHYHCGTPVNQWLAELQGLPRNVFYAQLAQRIDQEIHSGYRLYPCNWIAYDLLGSGKTQPGGEHYQAADVECFEHYLQGRLAKIQIPNKDEAFLRERLLTMYANPVRNWMKSLEFRV